MSHYAHRSDGLCAFLSSNHQNSTPYPPKTPQNRSCEFYEHESLCTGLTDGRFQTKKPLQSSKRDLSFLAETVNGNGFLIRLREALTNEQGEAVGIFEVRRTAQGFKGVSPLAHDRIRLKIKCPHFVLKCVRSVSCL